MNTLENEARLERSLRQQIRAPQLDRRFDAAVWARIEKAEMPVQVPAATRSAASRWLFASNVLGIAVAIALIVYVVAPSLAGADVHVALPQVAPGLVERIVSMMIWPVTLVALGFGLMFTSVGRRLRAEFL